MTNEREKYLLEKIEEYESLASEDIVKYAPQLIEYFEELAALYEEKDEKEKAGLYYAEAVGEYSFLSDTAENYENNVKKNEDALEREDIKKFYFESLQIYKYLAKNANRIYADCKKVIRLWGHDERYSDGYHYLLSLEFFEKIKNDHCRIRLAKCYSDIGLFFIETGDFTESLNYYLPAAELYERLEKIHPEDYVYELLNVYIGISATLYKLNSEEAKEYYIKAVELCIKNYKKQPEHFIGILSWCCRDMGATIKDDHHKMIKKYHLRAIELCEGLYKVEPEKFLCHLSTLYLSASSLYSCIDFLESEKYALKAIEINEKYYSDDNVQIVKDLANGYNNAAVMNCNQKKLDKARVYYAKATETYMKLAKTDSPKYTPYVAYSFYNLGNVSENDEEREKLHKTALSLAKKYPEHDLCRDVIEALE